MAVLSFCTDRVAQKAILTKSLLKWTGTSFFVSSIRSATKQQFPHLSQLYVLKRKRNKWVIQWAEKRNKWTFYALKRWNKWIFLVYLSEITHDCNGKINHNASFYSLRNFRYELSAMQDIHLFLFKQGNNQLIPLFKIHSMMTEPIIKLFELRDYYRNKLCWHAADTAKRSEVSFAASTYFVGFIIS